MNFSNQDDADIQFGVDTNEPKTGKPVYIKFVAKEGFLEFWFSCAQTETIVTGLQRILDDIKSGAAYDSRH